MTGVRTQRVLSGGSPLFWLVAAAAAILIAVPATAHATAGDLYAKGTAYRASTYTNHRSVFGECPDEWVVDINANEGDAGRPFYAPEVGSVAIFSTGWGSGYGNSIIWTSADGREHIHVAHLSAFGATGTVAGGVLIGYAGSTGNSTGDHMHVSRAYDGAPAPVILSGHQIVPGWSGSGLQYYSAGQVVAAVSLGGVVNGMTYYQPVTITFTGVGVDASSLACVVDGIAVVSGTVIDTPGVHTITVTGTCGGVTYRSSATITIAQPPQPGQVPVFRFYNSRIGSHFYTGSHAERDSVVVGLSHLYAYEGIAYWMNPGANTTPLYRFYRPSTGTHFYTASAAERDRVKSTLSALYAYEGPAYNVSADGAAGAKPVVHRFYNRQNGTHFYTASEAERAHVASVLAHVYTYEGPAFYLGQ